MPILSRPRLGKILLSLLLGFTFIVLASLTRAHATESKANAMNTDATARIDHLEPPFWWAGMQRRQLQLMVHGPDIAALTPRFSYPGVKLESVQRVENPNYLFLNLRIDAKVKPGQFDIVFGAKDRQVKTTYVLHERAPGSATRKGVSSADVVLNLMPDRFANGDPSNDTLPQLLEAANRRAPSGRHGGDLQGIEMHLDHLSNMGYTALWPTPVVESNQSEYSYHGYAATDFYQVDARYGGNAAYLKLSAAMRARGMGLIQDIVLNHMGSGHWWMKDLPTPDWVSFGKFISTNHFRVAVQDPYASKEDAENFYRGWFVADMPDMNQSNPYLATYLIQNSIWWVEYAGLSGIRVDTFGYSEKNFLTAWAQALLREYPNLMLVGEEWSGSPNVVAHWLAGPPKFDGYRGGMPGMIDFPFYYAIQQALNDNEGPISGMVRLYEMLSHDYLYPHPRKMMAFEGNHDTPRLYSALNDDDASWRLAMTFLLTAPRIPQIYYGSEILMTSPKQRDDEAVRRDFPGGWQGDAVNAFTGVGLTERQKAAQDYLKKLMTWRRAQPLIHTGKLMHYGPLDGVYVYFRYEGAKKVMVVLNKNTRPVTLDALRFREMLSGVKSGTDILSGATMALEKTFVAPARTALVMELK